MTFKFTVNPKIVEVQFESGSCAEALAIFQNEKTALGQIFREHRDVQVICGEIDSSGAATTIAGSLTADGAVTVSETTTKKKPGRPPKEAVAPAPAPIPAAPAAAPAPPPPLPAAQSVVPAAPVAPPAPPAPAAAAPAPVTSTPGVEIPDFLRVPQPGAAAAVVAPPPPPVADAPVPAPGGPLADAITKECRRRATGAADNGQALADWLINCGVEARKGSTLEEVLACLPFTAVEKLTPIAGPSGLGL
jgi:hypothetical protein